MKDKKSKWGGYLFIAAGLAFLATAITKQQLSLYGLSVMFMVLGGVNLKHLSENERQEK